MDGQARKRHLHASVSASTAYGMAVGAWLGARAASAGWIEWVAFVAVLMFAPGIVMSRIDAKYRYSADD
jgi:hypothetical protein